MFGTPSQVKILSVIEENCFQECFGGCKDSTFPQFVFFFLGCYFSMFGITSNPFLSQCFEAIVDNVMQFSKSAVALLKLGV